MSIVETGQVHVGVDVLVIVVPLSRTDGLEMSKKKKKTIRIVLNY